MSFGILGSYLIFGGSIVSGERLLVNIHLGISGNVYGTPGVGLFDKEMFKDLGRRMVTETDVIRQVAEAKCPDCEDCSDEGCPCCQGTGLRWPTLSRLPQLEVSAGGSILGSIDVEAGRVPDVMLEKVLDLIAESVGGLLQFSREHTDPDKGAFFCRAGDTYQIEGTYEYTRLEAACAALLST